MSITRRSVIGKISTAVGFLTGTALGRSRHARSEQISALGQDKEQYPGPIDNIENGQAIVLPDYGTSAEYGTWTVTYKVGSGGISQGGYIRVQLPDEWHAGERNSANRLQASNHKDNNYVTAQTSRSGAELRAIVESETDKPLVKNARTSLDGRSERYVFVVRVKVVKGNLKEGDTISVVYGDRLAGSAGYRAAAVSTPNPLPIEIEVMPSSDKKSFLLQNPPTITARPGAAVEMLFHLPSQAVVDRPLKALIALVDKEDNPSEHSAVIGIAGQAIKAVFPREVRLPPRKGWVEFEVIPRETGILRLKARAKSFQLQTYSNPALVNHQRPEQNIYWGDTHSHTKFSWDGVGYNSFEYARYTSGLDFYAMTDHACLPNAKGLTRGLCDKSFPEYSRLTEKYHEPHKFVTLHAHECSLGTPYGHHNIYFRDRPGPLFYHDKEKLPRIWQALQSGQALTIPHHTGKFPSGIDWIVHNPDFRRNIEIYSGHGLSEAYDPDHPLAFEQSLFTGDSRSLKYPSHVQDAWIAGLFLSAIASSDDHRSHPGQPHYGLTAVRATELTRHGIFQALYDRQTYATTGAKIILDFTLNGIPMGRQVEAGTSPKLDIRAIGTDVIEKVELLRHQPPGKTFEVIQSWQPEKYEVATEYVDENHRPGAIYYIRLRQKYRIRDRDVMAWSSPIWTKKSS